MTRIKKGLLAVLLCVMAIALGLASFITFGTVKADEGEVTTSNNVTKFMAAIDRIDYDGDYAELLPAKADEDDEESYAAKLAAVEEYWLAYNEAYNLYSLALTDDEHKNLDTAYQTKYNSLTGVFGSLYSYIAYNNSNLYYIANPDAKHPLTYDNNKLVADFYAGVEKLGDAEQAYINKFTNNLANAAAAQNKMDELGASITAAINAIKAIEYYDTTASGMAAYNPENTQIIVLASKTTIEAAEAALTAIAPDLAKQTKYYDIAKVTDKLKADTDLKYVFEGADDAKVDLIAVYNAAVDGYKLQLDKVFAEKTGVNALLKAAYEAIVAGTNAANPGAYYTLASVQNAIAAYNAIEDKTGHNDLQGLVAETIYKAAAGEDAAVTYADLYNEMNAVVSALNKADATDEGTIDYIEALIDEKIPDVDSDDYNFTGAFKDAIDAVQTVLDTFYTVDSKWYGDIQAHDQKVFDKEIDEAYIIENYAKFAQAVADYAEWAKEVNEIIEKVRVMVESYRTGEAIDGVNAKDLSIELEKVFHKNAGLTEGAYEVLFKTEIVYDAASKTAFEAKTDTDRDNENYTIKTTENWWKEIWADVSQVLTLVNDLDTKISTLYNDTHGEDPVKSLYAERDVLAGLVEDYNALDDTQKSYVNVTNREYLETMQKEVAAAEAALEAWRTLVTAITLTEDDLSEIKIATIEKDEDGITIVTTTTAGVVHITYIEYATVLDADKWASIADAQAKYVALNELKDAEGNALTAGVWKYLKELTAADDADEDVANLAAYNKFIPLYNAQQTLAGYLKDLATLMDAIETDNLDTLGLENGVLTEDGLKEIQAWSAAVALIKEAYDIIGDDTEEDYYSVKAQETLQTTYKAEYANYLKALEYFDAYYIEGLIAELPEAKDVTLLDGPAINNAKKEYDDYIKDGGDSTKIRNLKKLNDDLAKLAELSAELDAWVVDVIKLIDSKYDATDKDGAALVTDLTAKVKTFLGYPLDLTAYADLQDAYDAVIAKVGEGADVYLADALVQYNLIGSKSDKAIEDLKADIDKLVEKNTSQGGLTAGDYEAVKSVEDRYDSFHKTQQDLIDNYDSSFDEVIVKIMAADLFNDMVEKLYIEVFGSTEAAGTPDQGKNLTTYVAVMAESIKCIYLNADSELRKLYDATWALNAGRDENGNTPLDRVLAAYNKAVEDGTVIDIIGELEAIEGGSSTEDIQEAIDTAIAAAKTEIETAYNAAIKTATDALKATLDAKDTELAEAIEQAKQQIAAAKTELNTAITTAVNAAKADLEKAYADADEALRIKLMEEIGDLETRIADLDTVEAKYLISGDKTNAQAIADLKEELQGEIDKAKAALTGDITTVSTAVKNAETAAKNAEEKVAKLEADLNAVKTDVGGLKTDIEGLTGKIDSLQSSITGLTVGIIIVAIATAAALAGVIVIFLKKKN